MPRALMLIFFLFFSLYSHAQSATGPPETSLAGIELGHTTIADIEKMYGKANVVSNAGGTTLFQWQRLTVALTIATQFDPKNPSDPSGTVISVAVQGEGDNKPISRTGRGLKLGAKVSDVKKIYGVEANSGTTTLNWPNGTTLSVRLADNQKIDRLELTTSASSNE
jgi:hypothetical protein